MLNGQDVLSGRPGLEREWLLANGLGGFSHGTLAGALTRWSHGLVLAAGVHGQPLVLLLQLDARIHLPGGPAIQLGTHVLAPGQAAPEGHRHLEAVRLDPWPVWRFRVGAAVIEKSVMPIHQHHAVAVTWRLLEGPPLRIAASPLITARDLEGPAADGASLRGASQAIPGRVRIETRPDAPALTLWHNGQFLPARVWQRGLWHTAEGDGAIEDALVPGHVEAALDAEHPLLVVASAEDGLFRALAAEERLGLPPARTLAACVQALEEAERERAGRWSRLAISGADFTARQAAAAHGGPYDATAGRPEPLVRDGDPLVTGLAFAVRDGLTRRGLRLTLVRSLPHGLERGADALRAVPALVALRAFDLARAVLRGYLEFLDEGLAPESFDAADGTPRYGDPAVSLWLVHAADVYVRRSADGEFLEQELYPALEGVLQFYRAGTRHGIRVDGDGLLCADPGGTRPAALNALWGHALVAMAQLARLVGRRENGAFYLAWARELQRHYHEQLWDETRGCLVDALTADGPREGLAPDHVLAVSLAPMLLPPDRARRLVQALRDTLFTPWGLKTSPGDTRVDPAWLGPFATAWLRVHERSPRTQDEVRRWYHTLMSADARGVVGRVPEAFELRDGGAVPAPGADPVSVLAAAELLRAWIEEVDLGRAGAEPERAGTS